MKEFEAQKIIESLESIAAEKGANALTGEVIEEYCRVNGVDPEDFRNFICENIDLQEIKKLQGLEELSFEELDQVAGGAQPVKRGIASFLAATSLLGSTANFTASAAPFGANQSTSTAQKIKIKKAVEKDGKDEDENKKKQNQGFWTKEKILKAMGIGSLVVGAPLLCWALWPRENDSTSQALSQQATADLIIANISKTVDFAKRISADTQEMYDRFVTEHPDIDKYSDNFVDKIVDLMQQKLKSSYNVDKDYSVEIPGVSDPIKVSTFLSDYIYARLHGTPRGSYDLAVYVLALCLGCKSIASTPTVLKHIPDPNDPDYNTYKKILDDISKALKLEAGNIETLQQERDRARVEDFKRQDIATIENLKRYLTPGSTVWQKCTDCIAKLESSLQPPYYHQEYPRKEVSELENRMYREFTALEHISNLQDGFSNPKTIFERYLIKVSNYFKEKLESGATYDSLNESSKNDLRYTLEFLGKLAQSSDYAKGQIERKIDFLNDLKSRLDNLIKLLQHQSEICCESDKSELEDLLKHVYTFYNVLENITMCFDEHKTSDYYDRLSGDKYASKTTDREILQVIFNDKRVGRELDRSTERSSLQTQNKEGTKNELEQSAALEYQSDIGFIKNILRLDNRFVRSSTRINKCCSVITNVTTLIKRTRTQREIKVYRGINTTDSYVRRLLTSMVKDNSILDNGKEYDVNMLFDLDSIQTKLEENEEMIYKDPGFMSTSVSKRVVFRSFAGPRLDPDSMKTVQEITVPSGTPCYAYQDNVNGYSCEKELLFLPGTKLKLKGIKIIGGTPSKDHPGYTHNPKLVVLRFDMIPPTDAELEQAAKDRAEWWRTHCK